MIGNVCSETRLIDSAVRRAWVDGSFVSLEQCEDALTAYMTALDF